MRLKDIIRAEKQVTDWGKWRQEKMPASTFPLSRRRGGAYRLSGKYTWRVVKFTASGYSFRLLVAFRTDLSQYEAVLGLVDGKDTKVLASYEYHGTHDGWHLHASCEPFNRISPGMRKTGGEERKPKARSYHRRTDFDVNEGNALNKAIDVFKLPIDLCTLI